MRADRMMGTTCDWLLAVEAADQRRRHLHAHGEPLDSSRPVGGALSADDTDDATIVDEEASNQVIPMSVASF